MKAFYSIMYISSKPVVKEQLSIGLFMSNGETSFFHYANEKLGLVRKLLVDDSFELIKSYLEGFAADIGNASGNFKSSRPDYFSYLSDYNNNLIAFSKPVSINLELNQSNFVKLFEKFVFKYIPQPVEYKMPVTPHHVVKEQLYPKIKSRVNINKKLTPKEVPGLLIPKVTVDFIGRNDNPVAGEVMDFTSASSTLSNNIGHFMTLIDALKKDHGKYYIIGEEPHKNQFQEQHFIWSQIRKSDSIEFVSLKETEKISQYMEKHHVRPFVVE